MLFAAGVGIGLLFFGVSEPMYYLQNPPLGITAGTEEAATVGISATVFHWGLHGWAIYGMVGLALGFFAYNKKLPLTIRSAFYPLFGDRIWGWPGHILIRSPYLQGCLGLRPRSAWGYNTIGLNYLFDVPATSATMVMLIVVITCIALTSVLTGINVGIKRLSQFNIILAFLLLTVIILGPTRYIFRSMLAGFGSYLAMIVPLSNWWAGRYRICTIGRRSLGHGGLLGHRSLAHSISHGSEFKSSCSFCRRCYVYCGSLAALHSTSISLTVIRCAENVLRILKLHCSKCLTDFR